ncbi:hypothetical protein ACOL3C_09340 [Aliarcobacter butzleri]
MNQNRLNKYSETNEKNSSLDTIYNISNFNSILYILSIEQIRIDITNHINSNKIIVCNVHNIKIEVSKSDGWIIDNSYKFVKGPTKLIISRCETKE